MSVPCRPSPNDYRKVEDPGMTATERCDRIIALTDEALAALLPWAPSAEAAMPPLRPRPVPQTQSEAEEIARQEES